ncbi:MAG: hypothetical protein WBL23_03040 [Salinisphaera sp.]|uniref:hypothetical protein n=1 Tax=Salinisphaera sp. TaxID=1914330 RepID=UPI003C7DD389
MRTRRYNDGGGRRPRRLLWALAALACLVSAIVRAYPAAHARHWHDASPTATTAPLSAERRLR